MDEDEAAFVKRLSAKADRKLKAQHAANHTVRLGLGMFGLVGWSVAVPTILGALLGTWWDTHHPGVHSWTLALLVGGLVIGCAIAWHWVSRENLAMHDDSDTP
jgi:ATP synthase protein I